ncbi:MAG: YgfZ/GcvT domain-containing protein, partial [Steroidobacteraceae bacterium]
MFERDAVCVLDDIGTLRFSGADVEKFLQGQLSNDVSALPPGTLLRAGLHNPQGRVLALLWLTAAEQHDVLALLPRELLPPIADVLRRYVLRAKVVISDDSSQLRVLGLRAAAAGAALPGQRIAYGARTDQRVLLLQPVAATLPAAPSMSRQAWRALDLAAGMPQVYAATTGQFVAQMLNLDC